jgi:hypothetical protein
MGAKARAHDPDANGRPRRVVEQRDSGFAASPLPHRRGRQTSAAPDKGGLGDIVVPAQGGADDGPFQG